MKKNYPTPCIRSANLPTGEKFVFESPFGATVPFANEQEARVYVMENKMHRKYGRVFIETSPKRFATLLVDDSGSEDEPIIND
jgi:hypothetical protein